MKKILVAIEISRPGGNEKILSTARTLAAAMDGELTFMHAIEPIPGRVLAEIQEDVAGKQQAHAEAAMKEIVDQHEGATGLIRMGAPSTEILECAQEMGADLIVMHSHDPDMTNYIMGSVAGRVVRHAHCSVHIVRQAKAG